jgi:hypothetical protein
MNPYCKTKCECCGKAVHDLHKFYQFTDEETGDSLYHYPLGPHLYALCEDCRVIAFTDYHLFYFVLKGIDTRPDSCSGSVRPNRPVTFYIMATDQLCMAKPRLAEDHQWCWQSAKVIQVTCQLLPSNTNVHPAYARRSTKAVTSKAGKCKSPPRISYSPAT